MHSASTPSIMGKRPKKNNTWVDCRWWINNRVAGNWVFTMLQPGGDGKRDRQVVMNNVTKVVMTSKVTRKDGTDAGPGITLSYGLNGQTSLVMSNLQMEECTLQQGERKQLDGKKTDKTRAGMMCMPLLLFCIH